MDDRVLAAVLAAGAAVLDEPALARLGADLAQVSGAPVPVGVCGRPGAGRDTVRHALRGADVVVADQGGAAEIDVYVFTETLTPEDRAALSAARRPMVAVLNKADLICFAGARPMAEAAARCRELQSSTGVPTRPLAALLAGVATDPAGLDPDLAAALRRLSIGPSGLAGSWRIGTGVRRRLLAELDLVGVAIAAAAVSGGAGPEVLTALFREFSGIQGVLEEIGEAAAVIRYRRLLRALAPLAERAVGSRGAPVAAFLAGDAVVLARMAAASEVVTPPAVPGWRDALLCQAIYFQRYARGPVSGLHRECGIDIARGALRQWRRAGDAGE